MLRIRGVYSESDFFIPDPDQKGTVYPGVRIRNKEFTYFITPKIVPSSYGSRIQDPYFSSIRIPDHVQKGTGSWILYPGSGSATPAAVLIDIDIFLFAVTTEVISLRKQLSQQQLSQQQLAQQQLAQQQLAQQQQNGVHGIEDSKLLERANSLATRNVSLQVKVHNVREGWGLIIKFVLTVQVEKKLVLIRYRYWYLSICISVWSLSDMCVEWFLCFSVLNLVDLLLLLRK